MCQILQNGRVTSTQMSCRWERTQSAPEPCWLRWLHCRGRWHSHSVSCLLPGRFLCLLITLISPQLSQCCPLFSLYKCFLLTKGFPFLLVMHLVMHGDPRVCHHWSLELLVTKKTIHKSHLVQIALPDVSKI